MKLTYDGPFGLALLRVFHIFVTSVLFGATAVPYVVFAAVVGWQPTHLAVWLGVATLLPLGPSLHGLLATAEAVLAEDAPSGAARTFVAAWWLSARALWWFWLGASALLVAMAYRLSLAWSSDPAVASVAVVGAGLVAGAVQLWFVLLSGADASTRGLLTASLTGLVRRPLLTLAAVVLPVVALWLAGLPLVGPSLMLFLPGALGVALVLAARGRMPRVVTSA
ncbi:MAG TPA: hypothetical protein PKM36_10250 [Propionibacteriaceae bacterium]|nr:hypothetical protein [Propionibacteriaceae bacterium]HPZ50701.1 hypothetical protein [Propionibacteriaceae bacterium]HQE32405.1 hypothetical protein [Propionibacteriaceae bacterium]